MTKRKMPQGSFSQRKKSVSKAPASNGRDDSQAVAARHRKEGRTAQAQQDPSKLARVYAEREPKEGKDRKSRLTQKEKAQTS